MNLQHQNGKSLYREENRNKNDANRLFETKEYSGDKFGFSQLDQGRTGCSVQAPFKRNHIIVSSAYFTS